MGVAGPAKLTSPEMYPLHSYCAIVLGSDAKSKKHLTTEWFMSLRSPTENEMSAYGTVLVRSLSP